MKKALVIEADDIKAILAEKYNVSEKIVIKSQYSYTVILNEEESEENNGKTMERSDAER